MTPSSTGKLKGKSTSELIGLASTIPTNLHPSRGKLIGRGAEMRTVCEKLRSDEVRLITLTGFGGAGKTALAIHVAHSMLEQFPGGLFFVDLAPITEPTLILPTIARTIGVQEEPRREISETLRDFLANRSILFVLDNFEQVIHGAPIIAEFLDANPYVHIFATSREALRLRGEQVIPLASLDEEDAIQTFVQYAQTASPQFRLTEDNTPAISELCKKLDGLPLAIELAAMRARMFTPHALLARLTSDLGTDSPLLATLTSGPRDMPERQQTMRATIAWSYSLLAENEKRLLQVMSLFVSGVGIQPLVSVAGVPVEEALALLASLVDKSLVVSIPSEAPRFHLLESIREFAREQATASSEWNLWNAAFVLAFGQFARAAADEIETGDSSHGMALMELESANLLAALDITFISEEGELFSKGILLMEGLEQYWFPRQLLSEARQYTHRALKRMDSFSDLKPHIFGILYSLEGSCRWSNFNYEEAKRYHALSFEYFNKTDDEKRLGRVLNNLAVNMGEIGDHDGAQEYYTQALMLARKTADIWNEIHVLGNLGVWAHQILRDHERALDYWQTALVLAQKLGRVYEASLLEFNIACWMYAEGHFDRAEKYLRGALDISREHAFPQVEAFSCGLLGMVEIEQRNNESAAGLLEASLNGCRANAIPPIFYEVLQAAAALGMARKQYKSAAVLLGGVDTQTSNDPFYRAFPLPRGFDTFIPLLKSSLGEKFEVFFKQGQMSSVDELHEIARSICEFADVKMLGKDSVTSMFTGRELEVLRLLAQGRTNEEISNELVVVLKTVEKHVANVLRKLGVKNRTEAAAWAVERNLFKQ